MSARWSAQEMGLQVQDVPRQRVKRVQTIGPVLDALETCPECGRRGVVEAGFEGYDPRTESQQVLCGWCGWVTG